MSFLPYIDKSGALIDGACFHVHSFCKRKCSGEKCQQHYRKMKEAATGAYRCPYGLSSYVYVYNEEKIIFTGLRIRGFYDKKSANAVITDQNIYNPVIDEITCVSIVRETVTTMLEQRNLEEKLDSIRDLLHEARKLNGQIKNSIDSIWGENIAEDNLEPEVLLSTLKNVHVCSYMIANRFSYFDSVLNPTLSAGEPYSANIFKKFDKMRKLLKGYLHKNVRISLESPVQCNYHYNIYPTFETLLFILLENAIKYSPEGKNVEVRFDEKDNILNVTIQSTGPYCEENEILHLCEKGFRGENAKASQKNGQGFGLNFAKMICNTHDIGINFRSTYSHKDHGIKYGIFVAELHFDNKRYKDI